MSDTKYNVNSGFYDSVDHDRLYSADQMNMPYKRLVSNGIFATPQGTPSTDFYVETISGMNIKVNPGNGIVGDKWVELESDCGVTVSSNSTANPRIDSVILRTDRTSAVRAANIIYRTGTPAASPVHPDLTSDDDIYELRLCDIRVNSGTTAINQSDITDTRGSSECPWITSLIRQVDTSVLFNQWRDAYDRFYSEAQAQWDEFFSQLASDLTLQAQVVTEHGSYTTTGTTTSILLSDMGINNFDPNTDIITVYINGIYASVPDRWTLSYDPTAPTQTSIDLVVDLPEGQTVYAVIVKSVMSGDVTTLTGEVNNLKNKIPDCPVTTDGTYCLTCSVVQGVRTYSWTLQS